MTSLLSLLRTLNMDMQLLCLNIVHTLVINETLDDKTLVILFLIKYIKLLILGSMVFSCWIQPLLLLKSYSCSTKLQRLLVDMLVRLVEIDCDLFVELLERF